MRPGAHQSKLRGMNSFLSTAPPLVFVAGPWLFLGLALSGPFLLLLTVLLAAAAVPLIVATPFLVWHHRRALRPRVAIPRVAFELRRVAA